MRPFVFDTVTLAGLDGMPLSPANFTELARPGPAGRAGGHPVVRRRWRGLKLVLLAAGIDSPNLWHEM